MNTPQLQSRPETPPGLTRPANEKVTLPGQGGARKTAWFPAALVAACLFAGGCSPRESPQNLRVALLPDMDSLPFIAASEQGYFAARDLAVEMVVAASAAERDQLLQSGRVDVVVTDLVALALYNRSGAQVTGVRHSMCPEPGRPQFRLVAGAASAIHAPADLRGVPIAVSEGTVIEFVVRQALAAAGLAPDDISLIGAPGIATRMAMLESGQLQAACLPEPMASLAVSRGARPVADAIDTRDFSCSIIAVRRDILDSQRHQVEALLQALDQAAADINASPHQWRRVAAAHDILPPELADSYAMMPYPSHSVPPEGMLQNVVAWLRQSGRLTNPLPPYQTMIDPTLRTGQPPAEQSPMP